MSELLNNRIREARVESRPNDHRTRDVVLILDGGYVVPPPEGIVEFWRDLAAEHGDPNERPAPKRATNPTPTQQRKR